MRSSGLGTKLVNTVTGSTNIYTGLNKLSEDLKFKLLTPFGSIPGNPQYGSNILLSNHPGVIINSVEGKISDDNNSIQIGYNIEYNANKVNDVIILTREGNIWL